MKKTIKISPKNSLILLMDQSVGQIPDSMNGELVSANDTCIAVGTLSEFDGETEIILMDNRYMPLEDDMLVYEKALETPGKELSVCSILNEKLVMIEVGENCDVRIFVNDICEPDRITIVIDN